MLLLALPSGGDAVQFGVSHRWFAAIPVSECQFVFHVDVQGAVLTYARCPGLVHRSCAAVCTIDQHADIGTKATCQPIFDRHVPVWLGEILPTKS